MQGAQHLIPTASSAVHASARLQPSAELVEQDALSSMRSKPSQQLSLSHVITHVPLQHSNADPRSVAQLQLCAAACVQTGVGVSRAEERSAATMQSAGVSVS